ncbi:MAG: hypothetical protein FWE67_10625 [Planctomycetaceae bacterium]|nr:hypothetical protein [Planctomycetaceae bacterium]
MNIRHFSLILFFVCFSALFSQQTSIAGVFDKEIQAENLYGQGVHVFFSGKYDDAADFFRQAEKLGSQDPRVYFFMALSYLRSQKKELAEETFIKAAQLELEGQRARDYNVSDALKRIQGKERIYLESFRKLAQKDWQSRKSKLRTELYGKEQRKDEAVLKALADSFVGAAPFGARSLHPFRTEDDPKDEAMIPADDLVPQASAKPVFKPAQEKAKPAQEMTEETKEEEEGTTETKPSDMPKTDAEEKKAEEMPAEEKKERKDDEDPFS